MSFYSRLEIWAPRPVDLRGLEQQIRLKLDDAGLSHDVMLDLHAAFSSGRSLVKIHPLALLDLIEHIHALDPDLQFSARGGAEPPEEETEQPWQRNFGGAASPPPVANDSERAHPKVMTRAPDGSLVRGNYIRLLWGALALFAVAVLFRTCIG
jgi:hypothetical protein